MIIVMKFIVILPYLMIVFVPSGAYLSKLLCMPTKYQNGHKSLKSYFIIYACMWQYTEMKWTNL